MLLLLSIQFLEVEFEFLTFEDVTISTTALARTRGDASIKVTTRELLSKVLIQGVALDVLFVLAEGGFSLTSFSGDFLTIDNDGVALVKIDTIVVEVVVSEGVSIDNNNAVLNQSVGTDEFVVGSVVNNIKDTRTAGDT